MTIPIYIRTVTGKKVRLAEPEKSDPLALEDFARPLANICRFVGQLREFYSVAEHCLLCYAVFSQHWVEISTRLARPLSYSRLETLRAQRGNTPLSVLGWQVLMHELEEPFVGDASTQFKVLCPEIREVGKKIAEAFAPRLGVLWPPHPIVKEIDLIVLRQEHIYLCDNRAYADEHLGNYSYADSWFCEGDFRHLSPRNAYDLFYSTALGAAPANVPTSFLMDS